MVMQQEPMSGGQGNDDGLDLYAVLDLPKTATTKEVWYVDINKQTQSILYMTFVKRNSHPGEISCPRGHHVDFCCITNVRLSSLLPRYLLNQSPLGIIIMITLIVISDSSCVSSVGDKRTPWQGRKPGTVSTASASLRDPLWSGQEKGVWWVG